MKEEDDKFSIVGDWNEKKWSVDLQQ